MSLGFLLKKQTNVYLFDLFFIFNYLQMEARDARRWQLADTDQDGELTKLEFQVNKLSSIYLSIN